MSEYTKILLSEDEMPTQWYNIIPDLPEPPPPPLHPVTREPATADDLAPLFWVRWPAGRRGGGE